MRNIHGGRRRRVGRAAALLAVTGVTLHAAAALPGQPPLTVDDVVARAAAYVEDYIEKLSTVVMEEEYRQTSFSDRRGTAAQIRLVSEFLLMRVQGVGEWIGFRDVFEVNGRQVRDRQDRLATLFLGDTTTALAQARRIAQESSRYNLGSTGRTVNVPTYALFYLHPANTLRLRFEKEGEGCADEDTAWDVRFEEVEFPTLARGFENIDLPSRGHFCLDPVSGRVIETELELHHPSVGGGRLATDAKVRVTFAFEPRLNLWVPEVMRETYSERGGGSTTATARYRNYRQFSVTVSENSDIGTAPPAGPDRPE